MPRFTLFSKLLAATTILLLATIASCAEDQKETTSSSKTADDCPKFTNAELQEYYERRLALEREIALSDSKRKADLPRGASSTSLRGAASKCTAKRIPMYRTYIAAADHPESAYATIVLREEDVQPALALFHSIAESGSKFARIVLLNPNITLQSIQRLEYYAALAALPEGSVALASRSLAKQYLWDLNQYKKVLYLEPTTIVVKSMDELFDIPSNGILDYYSAEYNPRLPPAGALMVLVPAGMGRKPDGHGAWVTELLDRATKLRVSKEIQDAVQRKDLVGDVAISRAAHEYSEKATFVDYCKKLAKPIQSAISKWYLVAADAFLSAAKNTITGEVLRVDDRRTHAIYYRDPLGSDEYKEMTAKYSWLYCVTRLPIRPEEETASGAIEQVDVATRLENPGHVIDFLVARVQYMSDVLWHATKEAREKGLDDTPHSAMPPKALLFESEGGADPSPEELANLKKIAAGSSPKAGKLPYMARLQN